MSNVKQIAATGAADGTVELAEFPYNPLSCQIHTMRFYNAQGQDITDTLTSGVVYYEFQSSADPEGEWRAFDIAKRNVLTDGITAVPKVTATLIRKVRATFTGFPADTSFRAISMCQYDAMPEIDARAFGGTQALNVQFFPEANSKNGTQYEAEYRTTLAAAGDAGDTAYLVFDVGSQPIALKDVITQFKSLEFEDQFYRFTDFNGGTPVDIFNLNDELAVPELLDILSGATINDIGEPVSPAISTLGNLNQGNKAQSNIANTAGVERIMWRNRTYAYRMTNLDSTNPCPVRILATWYQGGLSIEL